MKVIHPTSTETVIRLSTAANRSLGVFLVFLGLVGTLPTWYLICAWTRVVPQTRADWYPSLVAAAVISGMGFLLAVHSRKQIRVLQQELEVRDGLFRKALHFRWSGTPIVRLQHVEREEGIRRHVTWLVKLVSERYEYTVDERIDQQLESRALAEALAKLLVCPLKERTEEGTDVIIDPRDLDLPLRERVTKYPALLGKPMPRPAGVPLRTRIIEDGAALDFSWSLLGPTFILDILVLGAVFFVLSTIPERQNQPSLWEVARTSGNYTLYLWVAAVITLMLLLVIGLRISLRLDPASAQLRELFFGLPLRTRTIPNREIEEVRLFLSVQGPAVQIVSDRRILQFRAGNVDLASWLAFEIRCFLLNREAAICGCREGSQEDPQPTP